MNVRKVLAGSLAAITAGATLAFGVFGAGLGDYVTPDTNKITSPIIVIGAPAQPSSDFAKDVLGAADIAAAVAGYATTTVSAGGSITTAVTGAADLSTTNTKLYVGSMINAAKTTLTKGDTGMGTLLGSGSVYDDTGTEFKYDQYIAVGGTQIAYSDSDGDIDEPALYLNVGTNTATPVYTARIVFSKALNISSTDVKSQDITMFGNAYTIGSESTATALFLYGGAQKNTVSEGETATITVSGTEHILKVIGVSSTTVAVVEVDGVSKEIIEGRSYTINGDKGKIDVYIDAVYFFGKESQVSSVRLSLGSAKIKLATGDAVKSGTDLDSIDGTLVTVTGDPLSKLEVAVAMSDSDEDHVAEGAPFMDPVFGSFQVAFGGIAPALDSSARTTTMLKTSGDDKANIKYTDYRGNEKEFTFAYDNDTNTATVTPVLGVSSSKKIVVVEGGMVNKNDYVILASGDFSHLFQLSDVDDIGTSTAEVELTDVFDSSKITINMQSPGYTNSTAYIDGQEYFVNAAANSAAFSWGTNAAAASAGNETTLFPMLGGKNGEALALIDGVTLANATYHYFPGGSAGYTVAFVDDTTTSVTAGQVTYEFASSVLTSVNTSSGGFSLAAGYPVVLLLEEKGKDTTMSEVRNAIVMQATYEGTSPMKMDISSTVLFTDATAPAFTSSSANTYTSLALDRYGAHVTKNTEDQNTVTISYPDEQANVAVGIGPNPSFTSAGGAVEVETAVKITSPVAKLASEVQAMINANTLNADLILVGGPCANSLVETLATNGHIKTCDTWDYTTGVIKEVADAFVTGKKALIVAGTMADDTRSLAAKVMQNTLSFEA
ncbi:MAG: hypothetical protein V3V26_00425 [Candidatus Aenigmarchaeota archaeon]